jgi:hypothetical protein
MTLMHAWRWLRYPRVAWDDRRRTKSWADQYRGRNTKWGRRPGFANDADVTVYWPDVRPCYDRPRDPKALKGWKLWLYAIGALAAALAIWWPADTVQLPVQEYPAVVPHQRPPHPICVYRIPGRC